MHHWQWHALRVLSSSKEAESGWGCLVLGDQGLYTCLQGATRMENGVAGAEPGLAFVPMLALQAEAVSIRAQMRASLGWAWTRQASLRTEAHGTGRGSEAARGVLGRLIEKDISHRFHCFWRTARLNWWAEYTQIGTEECTVCAHPFRFWRRTVINKDPVAWVCSLLECLAMGGAGGKTFRFTFTWFRCLDSIRKKVKKKIRSKSSQLRFMRWGLEIH